MRDPNLAFQLRIPAFTGEPLIIINAYDDVGWDEAGRVKLHVDVRQGGKAIFTGLECALHGSSDGIKAKELAMSLISHPICTEDHTGEQVDWRCKYWEYLYFEKLHRYCDNNGNVRER